ncbi:S49 family peptidase [bacterium]|nr:S49 family peptidase [bacterium]
MNKKLFILFTLLFFFFSLSFSYDYLSYSNNDGASSLLFNPGSSFLKGRSGDELYFNMVNGFKTFGYIGGGDGGGLGIEFNDNKQWILHFNAGTNLGSIGIGFNYHYDISKISKEWWGDGGAFWGNSFLRLGYTAQWGKTKDMIASLTLRPLSNSILSLSFDYRYFYETYKKDLFTSIEIKPIQNLGLFGNLHYVDDDNWELRGGISIFTEHNYFVGEYLDKDNFRINRESPVNNNTDKAYFNPNRILKIDISGSYGIVIPPTKGLMSILMPNKTRSYLDLILKLNEQIANKHVKGFYITIKDNELSLSQLYEIRQLLKKYKKINPKGKIVFYLAENTRLKNYYLASVGNKIIMNNGNNLYLSGLGGEILFYKNILEKFGVKGEFYRPEACIYKSATEPYTRDSASKEMKENYNNVLGKLYSQIINDIQKDKDLDIDTISAKKGFIYAEEAKKLGLITDVVPYVKDPKDYFLKKAALVDLKWKYKDNWGSFNDHDLGIISLSGDISESSGNSIFSQAKNISGKSYKNLVERIEKSKINEFIILVKSPGGSAEISERIFQLTELLKSKKKKIYVYMYDVAGSGGYYISANAHKIWASPFTITGSIGVLGGKFSIEGLLKKFNIGKSSVGAGQNNNFFSAYNDFNSKEKEQFITFLTETYDIFIDRVAKSRGLEKDYVRSIAKGKIYSASEGKDIKLIDGVGTFLDYIEEIKEENHIKKDIHFKYFQNSGNKISLPFDIGLANIFMMKPKEPKVLMLMEPMFIFNY